MEIDEERMEQIYNFPENVDLIVRKFKIESIGKKGVLFSVPSISDSYVIEEEIIKPLLSSSTNSKDIPSMVSVSSINETKEVKEAVKSLNIGETLLLLEGSRTVYLFRTSSVQGRSIEKPQNETTLFGPKESFIERVDANISLVRKKIRSEDFIVEKLIVGSRSNNEVYVLYNKSLVNDKILKEVKKRITAIDKDSVQNLDLLAQLIEERKKSLFPTVLQTERPDRAASFLEDGFIVLLMNNSPTCLIAPATFWSFFHSADDHYLRFLNGNFTRFLRMLAIFITLFTPSIYIAITNYHIEMIPIDLLLAIAGAREMVPFPAIVELLIMETAFELIREAGIRVPTPIGPTIGIVGALILGQAAVEANVVSPIVVIVVALTGLSSFAISDVNLNYALRITRFGFLLSASLFGIFGMILCFIFGLSYLSVFKSFGAPYFAPLAPRYKSSGDTLLRKVISSERFRPGFVKPKDQKKQAQNK
ncbi:spore germination protein [Bacillus sp. USDA818B3_A]|uniref:spore germination protein n=1 Tax=Bacillus sp. USDA818B3_A TaxID=2698834 RepID=UPI001F3D3738|nr:spore germination protein [Bacillus sp. USDA818B3_A]